MLTALRHNLSGLLTFSGRTRPLHFWLYTAVVTLSGTAAGIIAMGFVMQEIFARLGRFAREHPDQVTVTRTSTGTSWQIDGNHPELIPDIRLFLITVCVIAAVSVLLLAAAVTRRLHDSGRRGYWGLLPLPFLAGGMSIFMTLFADISGGEPDMALFAGMLLCNLAYLASLALLVVLLCLNGTRGENRFGPPPG